MSDEGMGSLLDSAPPVVEDVDELPSPSVAIDIHPTADRDEAAGQIAALLAAHAAETKKLEDRVATLEALRLSEKMAEAAEAASSAAASAAQSAAEAAQLVTSAGEAVETAAAVTGVAREALKQISADGAIPDLLAEHCKTAALSAKNAVVQALDDAREEALDFVEEQRAAVAQGKRSGKKR
jgi:hypothetical protein